MQTEYKAVSTLLERGVKVQIIAPLLFRLFGKRFISFVVKDPSLGTYYRISELFLKTGLDSETLDSLPRLELTKHLPAFSRIAAVAMLNSYWGGKLFARPLAFLLFWRLSPEKLHLLILLLNKGTEDFMNTIRSTRRLMMTKPNLSQATEGS